MTAAVALFIQYLPELIKGGTLVTEYVMKMRANYMARGEWPAEADAAFTAELAKAKGPDKPHAYKTDEELAAGG